MHLHELAKTTEKSKRRLGQGHGSGRVKTSGRGTKGQKARGDIPLRFEGGALPLIKRLPFLRGKQKNKSIQIKPAIINVSDLNKLPSNSVVDLPLLLKHTIVDVRYTKGGVKVLGEGELLIPLTVKVPVSTQAQAKIEKAGGTIDHATANA